MVPVSVTHSWHGVLLMLMQLVQLLTGGSGLRLILVSWHGTRVNSFMTLYCS